MADHDWSAAVADPRRLREVLGAPPPPLSDFSLVSLHIDERDATVALEFHALAIPTGAVGLWLARGHNAVEFSLLCTGVEDLAIDGWSTEPIESVTVDKASVVLVGPGRKVSFEAGEIHAEGPVGRYFGAP